MKPKTQKEAVLSHLKKKSLTMPDAVKLYNVYRLSDIIFKLRNEGYTVKTDLVPFKNKYGHFGSFAKYSLIKK